MVVLVVEAVVNVKLMKWSSRACHVFVSDARSIQCCSVVVVSSWFEPLALSMGLFSWWLAWWCRRNVLMLSSQRFCGRPCGLCARRGLLSSGSQRAASRDHRSCGCCAMRVAHLHFRRK